MLDIRSDIAVADDAASSTGDPSELGDGALNNGPRCRQYFWGSRVLCNGCGGRGRGAGLCIASAW